MRRVTKYYYHGGQRVAMRVGEEGGDAVYYLHTDHLGSTSLTTDSGGAVVARQLYHPYGEVRWSEGTLPTDFGFTGQRLDSGTGLVFMHARYYHPGLGRFISADTIVLNPGNPQSLNRYSYVLGNPLKYIDPSGHGHWIGEGGDEPEPPSPLSDELWLYAQQAATEFGLPPEFVAAVLWAEQEYDYSWYQDAVEDALARAALTMIEAQELREQLPMWARGLSGEDMYQGHLILGAIEKFDLSLGIGQVRLSTAREVAEYAASTLGLSGDYPTDLSTSELVSQLEDPQWNVRYMAGYLRKLADIRGTQEFTIQEMQILYGAYRTPLEMGPLELSQPGPIGSQLSPEVVQYYRDLLQDEP